MIQFPEYYTTRIPLPILEGLSMYAEHGVPTGGFLYACLANNFHEAVCRADDDSIRCIADIAKCIYNELPSRCHGSPERVREWIDAHERRRALALAPDEERQAVADRLVAERTGVTT